MRAVAYFVLCKLPIDLEVTATSMRVWIVRMITFL